MVDGRRELRESDLTLLRRFEERVDGGGVLIGRPALIPRRREVEEGVVGVAVEDRALLQRLIGGGVHSANRTPVGRYQVDDANTGEVLASGFATISDALDFSERVDPDESRGVFAHATAGLDFGS